MPPGQSHSVILTTASKDQREKKIFAILLKRDFFLFFSNTETFLSENVLNPTQANSSLQ